jgi:hypothetical protein
MKRKDKKQQIEKQTVDTIQLGEMQPEQDHDYSDNSNTGGDH